MTARLTRIFLYVAVSLVALSALPVTKGADGMSGGAGNDGLAGGTAARAALRSASACSANSVIVTPFAVCRLIGHTTRQLNYVRRAERMQYRCKYLVQVGSVC